MSWREVDASLCDFRSEGVLMMGCEFGYVYVLSGKVEFEACI